MLGGNHWRLSRLLRGRRGTEPFIGAPTPAGADFVLLDDAVAEIDARAALRGLERQWRIGPSRKPVGDEIYVQFSAADEGVGLRPFAPAHLKAARDATGDFALSWVRRSRQDNDVWGAAEAPGETREAYRVRVGAFRVEEVAAPTWTYDLAAQASDEVAGEVEIGVAQISDEFGPGPEARILINV